MKVGLLDTNELRNTGLFSDSSSWKVDLKFAPHLLTSIKKELETHFQTVNIIDNATNKEYDLIAESIFDIKETWSNASKGDIQYIIKHFLILKDPKTSKQIAAFSTTEEKCYYPPESAYIWNTINMCTLYLATPIAYFQIQSIIEEELNKNVGGAVSDAIKNISNQLLESSEIAEFAKLRKNNKVVSEFKLIKDKESLVKNGKYGQCHALVIGNNDYQYFPKLKTAKYDAKAVAAILKKEYNYNTYLLLNATRSDILGALSRLRKSLTVSDNLLIYYAGHGFLDKKADEGYWIPVDAEKDIEINWISNASITTMLKGIDANHVLLLADSCFSGKLTRGFGVRAVKKKEYMKKSRSVITAGGLEPVVDGGGKNGHSVFTSALLTGLQNNNGQMSATDLFKKVKPTVIGNSAQTPAYSDIRKSGHEGGEFQFIKTKNK